MRLEVKIEDTNIRIDNFIRKYTDLSRTYIETLIEEGYLSVNDIIIKKPSYKTKENDVIFLQEKEIEVADIVPKDIPIDVIYEDDDILVINKKQGMVVHPANGHMDDTLVNAIMYRCKNNLSTINGVMRPGIVHRIDRDTSGLIVVCKNDLSHKNIAEQFANHTHIRKYKAIVKGVLKDDEGVINAPIARDKRDRKKMCVSTDGRDAITEYKILERYNNYTYIELNLKTGRTHQIRVHMKHIGHPVLGDNIYGKKDKYFKELNGQVLHAYYMSFIHPSKNTKVEYEAPLPQYFIDALDKIRNSNL